MADEQAALQDVFPGLTVDAVKRGRIMYADVIAKYYGDRDFKERLDADPAGVLRAEGFPVPPGHEIRLVVGSEKVLDVVVPWVAPQSDGASED